MILELVRDIGSRFSQEDYLFWSRIQGTLWTLADIVIVYYLIRLMNVFRRYAGRRRHRFSYAVLAATLPFAAFIPFMPTARAFFLLELGVTTPHFVVILYLLAGDAALALRAIRRRLDCAQAARDRERPGAIGAAEAKVDRFARGD